MKRILFVAVLSLHAPFIYAQNGMGIGNNNPQELLDVSGAIRIGASTIGALDAGSIRWNGTNFQGYNGSQWVNLDASNSSNTLDEAYDEGGAGAGRQIDASDGAVRINGEDGFIVTGTGGSGDIIEITGAGTRMFFNPNKRAFRAGYTDGTEWDNTNVGSYSVALGRSSMAKGIYSLSFGRENSATATNSVAIGYNNDATVSGAMVFGSNSTVSGVSSIALGGYNNANGSYSNALGLASDANGNYSITLGTNVQSESFAELALGRYNTNYVPNSTGSWNASDRLLVVGNGTSTSSRSDAFVILKNGNIGIGTDNAWQRLTIVGIPGTDGIMFPDGTVQTTAAGSGTYNTLDEAYDQGGAGAGRQIDAADGAVRINGGDGLIVTGTVNTGDVIEVTGAGTRMFFNPRKAAFRAGNIDGTQWDDANIGLGSVAMGGNTQATDLGSIALGFGVTSSGQASVALGYTATASGDGAIALNDGTTASGDISFAAGHDAVASGYVSAAMGANTIASGAGSFAAGNWSTAESFVETVFGSYNTDYTPTSPTGWSGTDRLFVIGNSIDPLNRSDAMVVLKNGMVGFGTSTPATTVDINGWLRYQNGSEGFGKVLGSGADGTATWVDVEVPPSTIPLWNSETGTGYAMSNTTGQDLSNCEAGFIPTTVSSTGDLLVKVVMMVTSASGTNNFQLRAGISTFPIVNTDTWTWTPVSGGWVVESEWKSWSAGTTPYKLNLFGWQSGGGCTFTNAYVLVKPSM